MSCESLEDCQALIEALKERRDDEALHSLSKAVRARRSIANTCRCLGAAEVLAAAWRESPTEPDVAASAARALLRYASVDGELLRMLGCNVLCAESLSECGPVCVLRPVAELWRRLGGPTVEEFLELFKNNSEYADVDTMQALLRGLCAKNVCSDELHKFGMRRLLPVLEPLLTCDELSNAVMRLLCWAAGPLDAPTCWRGAEEDDSEASDVTDVSDDTDAEEVDTANAETSLLQQNQSDPTTTTNRAQSLEEASKARRSGVSQLLSMQSVEAAGLRSDDPKDGSKILPCVRAKQREEFRQHLTLDAREVAARPVLYPQDCDQENNQFRFFSDFEGGNLRRVRLAGPNTLEVLLCGDTNRAAYSQWFFFDVVVEDPVELRFQIVTFRKQNSTFREGQRIVLQLDGESLWRRAGFNYFYAPNRFRIGSVQCYSTLAFTLKLMPGRNRVAYFYPYLFGDLLADLRRFRPAGDALEVVEFGRSKGGRPLLRLNITDFSLDVGQEDTWGYTTKGCCRQHIIISSRVHPGESPASYVMRGVLQMLLSADKEAAALRRRFRFVILPILNPDGVAAGNGRSNSEGKDLNRCWDHPPCGCEVLRAKEVIRQLCRSPGGVLAFVDLHAHSWRHGAFTLSNPHSEALPDLLRDFGGPLFDRECCKFTCTGEKRKSARSVVWHQLGVKHAHTLEATYAAVPRKARLVTTQDLEELGHNLIRCCAKLQVLTPEDASKKCCEV